MIHAGIAGKISENAAAGSDRYVFHVVIGLAVMMILYLLDYTVLARFSKIIAVILLFACLVTLLGGYQLNGVKWGKILHCTAGRKRNIHADSDAVLCSHIWSNFV